MSEYVPLKEEGHEKLKGKDVPVCIALFLQH